MQTIGTRAGEAHRGDFIATCAYCGAAWYRSELRRNAAGQLICPDDQHIRDPVTLSRLNAARSSRIGRRKVDGGIADTDGKPSAGPLAIVGAAVVAGWEASSGITLVAGGRVSAWAAVSGGWTLTNADPFTAPLLKQDGPSGRYYVSYRGAHFLEETSGLFTRPAPSVEPTFYWAVVRRPRWVDASMWWGFGGVGPGGTLALIDVSEPLTTVLRNGVAVLGGDVALNKFRRIEAAFTGSTADYLKFGNVIAMSGVSAGNETPGGDLTGAFAYTDVCELWVLKAVPTVDELALLDEYANARYGGDVLQ